MGNLGRLRALRRHSGGPLIGVMLLEALGDIVACEPVIRHLRAEAPDARIVWFVKRDYAELPQAHPYVDDVLILHCLSERVLLMRSGLLDRCIDLHFGERHCSLCRRPEVATTTSSIGLANYFEHGGLLTAFSAYAGLPPLWEAPRLYIPQRATRRVDDLALPSTYVAVSCTSKNPKKDWHPEKWPHLLARLGLPVIEVGMVAALSSTTARVDLCGRLSILESAEVIRRAALYVGPDSGPAHLANAVGTPGVILMGEYLGFRGHNPFTGRFAKGHRSVILHADGPASELTVDVVAEACRGLLCCDADGEPYPGDVRSPTDGRVGM